MFIGHFAVGLAAKKWTPQVSLGTTFLAAQFIDLLWPSLLLLGLEQVEIEPGNTAFTPLNFTSYPYSHSFLMVLFWGLLFGVFYFLRKKNLKAALILGALVVSHWFLDLLVHRPDLPLTPYSDSKLGFGIWNSIPLTICLELALYAGGIFLFLKSFEIRSLKQKAIFWSLVIFLGLIWISNLFGPPPPSVQAIAIAGHLQWLFVFWGYWLEGTNKSSRKKAAN